MNHDSISPTCKSRDRLLPKRHRLRHPTYRYIPKLGKHMCGGQRPSICSGTFSSTQTQFVCQAVLDAYSTSRFVPLDASRGFLASGSCDNWHWHLSALTLDTDTLETSSLAFCTDDRCSFDSLTPLRLHLLTAHHSDLRNKEIRGTEGSFERKKGKLIGYCKIIC